MARLRHRLQRFSRNPVRWRSTANLMGLAMAREAKLPANHVGVRPCVVYCSAEAHFSIAKTVALLGIGKDNLRLIAVDKSMRMHPGTLRLAIAEDRQAGRLPIAVVATAGTVVSGAIDPLRKSPPLQAMKIFGFTLTAPMGHSPPWLFPNCSRD